jgi:hypothetical protein
MPHPVLRVSSTVRIPNPKRRVGQIGPLSERWADALARVRRELPSDHPPQAACSTTMMSELGLDDILDALEAALAAMPPPPDNPMIREARQEFLRLQREFNTSASEIKSAQSWLKYAVKEWRHVLLGDITADMFSVPPQLDYSTEFRSTVEAHEAVQFLVPRLEWVRAVLAKISAVRRFDTQARDQQTLDLVHALTVRKQESDARIIALEAAATALEARLNRLERGRKRKAKPTIRRAA